MGDIYCRVCGEPWDIAGVLPALNGREDEADMTKEEAEMLVKGLGCPACKGKKKTDGLHDEEYIVGLLEIDGEIDVLDLLFK